MQPWSDTISCLALGTDHGYVWWYRVTPLASSSPQFDTYPHEAQTAPACVCLPVRVGTGVGAAKPLVMTREPVTTTSSAVPPAF